MEKTVTAGIIAIIAMVMIVRVVQAMVPQPQFACPIDGLLFMTYDELYEHFITEHPAEPITIIWE